MMFLCGKGITTKSQLDVTPTLPARCILIHSIMTLLLLQTIGYRYAAMKIDN